MQTRYLSHTSTSLRPYGLLRRSVAVIGTVALAGVALMFSAVMLVFLLGVAVVMFAWLWWKTRTLRRQMRDSQPADMRMAREAFRAETFSGTVIEGEAVRVDAKRDTA